MIPTQTTSPVFRLSTDDATEFLKTLTPEEARQMLFVFLATDEERFIRLKDRIERDRARYAEAVTR